VIVQRAFKCPSGNDGTEVSLELNGSLQLAAGVYRTELLKIDGTVIRAINIKEEGDLFRIVLSRL
jgi:hypothetical protein